MYKPRGPQAPSFRPTGINPNSLIKFLEAAQKCCEQRGDADSALKFECMVEYFKHDYELGKSITFRPGVIGY